MSESNLYILGGGAIGFALAIHLLQDGKEVTLVRTSTDEVADQTISVSIQTNDAETLTLPVRMVSLSKLENLNGIVVVSTKSYANQKIATMLQSKNDNPTVVVMQNGINVENPFLEAGFSNVYRCVLYATAQNIGENFYSYRKVASSPIGAIRGDQDKLAQAVATLNTSGFAFHLQTDIQNDIWKKAIINAVFNSVCPLLEIDNGIFGRDPDCANLAREIVRECLQVAHRLGLKLEEDGVMEQLFTISQRSNGQLISTLQDINNRRETEIESLNLEIGRIAAGLVPAVAVEKTKFLGEMVLRKSKLHR
jgi:2-dehydropantoate 2-reductase